MTSPDFVLYLALLAFAPLAFGSVEPWSLAVLETAAFVALAIALRRRSSARSLVIVAIPGIKPLGLFLAFLLFQALPLPAGLVGLLSPRAHAIWTETLGSAGPLPWVSLSLAPAATARELLRFSSYAACYVLTVLLLSRPRRMRTTLYLLAAFAATVAFLALAQSAAAPTRLLFLRPAPADATPFGPYVNRNHFANLMAMITPIVLALLLVQRPGGRARSLRQRLSSLLARPESGARLLLGFAALLIASSIIVSLSRGGMAALCAALLVFGGGLLGRGRGGRRVLAVGLLAGAVVLFAGWFRWDRMVARFDATQRTPGHVGLVRSIAWGDTLAMARDFPLFGSGIGAFAAVYPRYRTLPGTNLLVHAHNDWLELLAGGGAIGFLLLAWFVAAVGWTALRAVRGRADPASKLLTLGAIAGSAAFLVHGGGDFSLAIGANGLYFFVLLGLCIAASHGPENDDGERTRLPRLRLPGSLAAASALLAACVLLFHAAGLTARHAWRLGASQARLTEALATPPASARRLLGLAARLDPLEAHYPATLARLLAREGNAGEAAGLSARALRRDPANPELLRQLAVFLDARGDRAGAGRAFDAAIAFRPADPAYREAYGTWLLARGNRAAAIVQLKKAATLAPGRLSQIIAYLVIAGLPDTEIAAVVPEQPDALLRFARYLETTGSNRAADAYRRVLALTPDNRAARAALEKLEALPSAGPP